MKSTKRFFF